METNKISHKIPEINANQKTYVIITNELLDKDKSFGQILASFSTVNGITLTTYFAEMKQLLFPYSISLPKMIPTLSNVWQIGQAMLKT